MSNVTIFPSIPEDILTEILPRVSSVKSLLRFKCLSKSWYNFISSENFAKTHLQKSVTNSTLNAVCITTLVNQSVVNHCSVDALFSQQGINDHDLVKFEIELYNHRYADFTCLIVGCSNGLCCILLSGQDFVLLNPFTRQYFKLPHPYDDDGVVHPAIKGFGYDEINNDYKVLVRWIKQSYRLYSLKKNSWKTVSDFMFPNNGSVAYHHSLSIGVFVNGKLHWPGRMDNTIVSFDLGSEAIGVVEEPKDENDNRNFPTLLGVIEGYLCVFRRCFGEGTQVWAMKEYGVKQSWCKMVTVPDLSYNLTSIEPHSPLYISEEGDVLVAHQSFKFVYNLKTKSRRRLVIKNSWRFDIGTCIQSLVSPFPPVNERMEEAELTG